ncbi:MAG: hypothetical protein DI535_22450 [Citrobacter freundii]|nr:MAG: hypothetical protein DI535_22450 [Citrobacter freundii]
MRWIVAPRPATHQFDMDDLFVFNGLSKKKTVLVAIVKLTVSNNFCGEFRRGVNFEKEGYFRQKGA